MFICVNYYCTKKTAPIGAAKMGGGWALVVAKAATIVIPNEILGTRSTLH